MAYTTIDKPSDYFNTVIYTGNGAAARGITGVGFQPDWVWVKDRSVGYPHITWDSVRTNKASLCTNTTAAEVTTTARTLTSFDSDGFTTPNVTGDIFNDSGTAFVSWNWKETATAGFDIVSFTGNGSARTISHSLSAIPKFMIIKKRSNASGWGTYHVAIGAGSDACPLNSTAVPEADTTFWNNTTPTSSVFSVGTNNTYNQNGETYICYLFADKQGYSKFGSHTGNGNADGTFVYTGFKPAFVMFKKTSATGNWFTLDNKRFSANGVFQGGGDQKYLHANTSNNDQGGYGNTDILSNGFKFRGSDGDLNGSGATYIYMAFAENPFVTSTGVPATAK
jgi:hypothetical protein